MSASPLPPQVLRKAALPGRIRGIATDTWRRAVELPLRAGQQLRDGVGRARALHSRERRLVQAGLYDLVRTHRRLASLLGTDEPDALWVGWLVEQGLPPEDARAIVDAPFEHLLEPERFEAVLTDLPVDEALALRHSLPIDLARRLIDGLGAEGATAFLAASDRRAPVTLRANRARTTRDALAARLAEEGVETMPCERAADGLHVVGRGNLTQLPSFRDGWFEVQDEGSQLLAALVPAEGEVIDLCAGAGGKSLAMAARGQPVTATDIRPGALKELQRRARRAGVTIETLTIRDARLPARLRRREVPNVLVDAPCTGIGVLRRHPEHRWHFDDAWLGERNAMQRRILDRAAGLVASGGHLVYGTCSVLPEENEQVVSYFLHAHRDFEPTGEGLALAPHTSDTDGFFGVVLRKR